MLRNNGGIRIKEGFKKSFVPLDGGRGVRVKNCDNHPYVINEWPLTLCNWSNTVTYRAYNQTDLVLKFPQDWRCGAGLSV